MTFKAGFVAIVGRPNAGKSTLLNQILQKKVAIISDKAQTTRTTLQGIYNREDCQLVFIDTPGIHEPKDLLGSFMNTTAINSVYGTDVVLFVAAANESFGAQEKYILSRLMEQSAPVWLVLNKIDLLDKKQLLEKLTRWQERFDFENIIPVSAKKGENIATLLDLLIDKVPEGQPFFDQNQITDHDDAYHVAEFIREKVLYFTREEVPHSIAVTIEKMTENEGKMEIMATIIVNRASQKGILIGRQGAMIKKIREASRREIKRYLQKPVSLELYVRVEKDWRNKARYLKDFGYREEDYS